jgi:hypothetical protein
VKPNLTFDLGLRYEVLTSPTEIHGRVANNLVAEVQAPLFRRMSTEPVIGKKVWETDFMKGFAPRLGVAWDPFSKGKTSVQGGFGVFYDQIEHDFRFFTHINAPFAPRAETALRGAFPVPWGIVQFTDLVPRGRSVDPNIEVPTVLHYNVGVEQQVGGAAMFRVGYVGAKGTNLLNVVETNLRIPELVNGQLFWSATAPVAEPRLGTWDLLMSEGTSRYDALQAEFQTRFAEKGALGRLRTKASYTFSKSTDIISGLQSTAGTNSRAKALDPFDLERDRGLSSHHVAHAFSWNFTYDLSGLPLTGIAGALATGWQVSGIWSVTDGVPINIENGIRQSRNGANTNVERPDLIAGGNDNPVLGGHITYFDATQFTLPAIGTLGNLGRNSLIGPGLSTFDLSLGRNIPIKQFSLQFRAEIFNIFNRANLGLPDRSLFTGAGVRRGAAGRITATSTQARQVQLGLKLVF